MNLSFYSVFSSNLSAQETTISTIEEQLSSGVTVETPDQNPAAYQQASLDNDELSALTSENTTQANIKVQIGSVSTAYQQTQNQLNSIQSILEQALNGTTNSDNMQALAQQVNSIGQNILSVANQKSSNGSYLFGGSRGNIAPFQSSSNNQVVYMGDGGASEASITPDSTASTIANGEAFVSGMSGDGISEITAGSSNSGSAYILSEGVTNTAQAQAFQTGSSAISVTFSTDSSGKQIYTATSNGTTVGTGDVSSTGTTTMQLAGTQFQISGEPANGDSFTISPSRPQSVFDLVSNIYQTLNSSGTTSADQAQSRQQLNQDLLGIQQYQSSFEVAQAQNGVTLQAVESASTDNTDTSTSVQTDKNNEIGIDTPKLMASLDENMASIQAAMKSFSTMSSLSLFSYL